MYVPIDEWINCGKHGHRVRGAVHLYVKNGDINNPEHAWLVCLACAQRMDRDPTFRVRSRAAFEEYQRHMREYLAEQTKDVDRKEEKHQ